MESYNKEINYIGSTKKQKKFTKFIKAYLHKVNYQAYIHDTRYKLSLTMKSPVLFVASKFFMDIEFLVLGLINNFFSKNIFLGIYGMIVIFFAYILILLYTPVYFINNYKRNK